MPWLKIISQENRGLGGARNTGILNSNGCYIWFIDGDDTIVDGVLKYVISYLKLNKEIYIFGYNRTRNNNSNVGNEVLHSVCNENTFSVCQVWRNIYKRSFLIENNLFFKEKYLHEDGEFNLRAFVAANKVLNVNLVIYNYHIDNINSIMNNISIKNQFDLLDYFKTFESLNRQNSKGKMKIKMNYLSSMLGLLFKNSCSLSKSDFLIFKDLLTENLPRLKFYWRNCSCKDFIRTFILYIFKSQRLYKLIYYKSL